MTSSITGIFCSSKLRISLTHEPWPPASQEVWRSARSAGWHRAAPSCCIKHRLPTTELGEAAGLFAQTQLPARPDRISQASSPVGDEISRDHPSAVAAFIPGSRLDLPLKHSRHRADRRAGILGWNSKHCATWFQPPDPPRRRRRLPHRHLRRFNQQASSSASPTIRREPSIAALRLLAEDPSHCPQPNKDWQRLGDSKLGAELQQICTSSPHPRASNAGLFARPGPPLSARRTGSLRNHLLACQRLRQGRHTDHAETAGTALRALGRDPATRHRGKRQGPF